MESKILPRCQISLVAYSVPSESWWGLHSPNPAERSLTAAATSHADRALQALSPYKVKNISAHLPFFSAHDAYTVREANVCKLF